MKDYNSPAVYYTMHRASTGAHFTHYSELLKWPEPHFFPNPKHV